MRALCIEMRYLSSIHRKIRSLVQCMGILAICDRTKLLSIKHPFVSMLYSALYRWVYSTTLFSCIALHPSCGRLHGNYSGFFSFVVPSRCFTPLFHSYSAPRSTTLLLIYPVI